MSRNPYVFNALSTIFLILSAIVFVRFLDYHELKCNDSGILLDDPILALLPLRNFSIPIFSVTYGTIVYGIFLSFKNQLLIGKFMFSYAVMLLLRILTLTILPLKAPVDLIYLQDPFLNNLIYPGEIKNDLFYSGHTALVFILFFLTKKKILLIGGVVLGLMLMAQRVHYSIDIIGAIPVSYFIVKMVNLLSDQLMKPVK